MRSGHHVRSHGALGHTLIILTSSLAIAAPGISGIYAQTASAGDWPAFLHDADRSGATREEVKPPLVKRWEFRNRRPGLMSIVAGGGGVFFGSNADNTLYCLDASTGQVRWSFPVGGIMRFAPWLANGQVFVGSDDGHVYCLRARDGRLKWKTHIGPREDRIIGYGRIESRWPVRSGMVLRNGVLYVGAGVFPSDGAFYSGLDPETGKAVWQRTAVETCAYGYLTVTDRNLYVPQNRVPHAIINLKTKEYVHELVRTYRSFRWVPPIRAIGWRTQMAGNVAFSGERPRYATMDDAFPEQIGQANWLQLVTTRDTLYVATGGEVQALAYSVDTNREKGQRELKTERKWSARCPNRGQLILAGSTVYSGGQSNLTAFDSATGQKLWQSGTESVVTADGKKRVVPEIDGHVDAIAAAEGRLFVATTTGRIVCFTAAKGREAGAAEKGTPRDLNAHRVVTIPTTENPFGGSQTHRAFEHAAEVILRESVVSRGYALVYGLETGELALQIARRTGMKVYCVSPDPGKVAAARRALNAAGVYGSRVCVDEYPLSSVPYPDYFADLVVSETAVLGGALPAHGREMLRMMKPIRGVAVIGRAIRNTDAAPEDTMKKAVATVTDWLRCQDLPGGKVVKAGGVWAVITRPPIRGADDWTHQWANAGSTQSTRDQHARPPLGVLWYGLPGPGGLQNRHHTASTPVTWNGRCFMVGREFVKAFEFYNGLPLWQRTFRRIGYEGPRGYALAVGPHGLFIKHENSCHQVRPETGQTIRTFTVPGDSTHWVFQALDEGILVGMGSSPKDIRFGCRVFAYDIKTGKLLWDHDVRKHGGNSIQAFSVVIGGGKVFVLVELDNRDKTAVRPEWRRQCIDELKNYAKAPVPSRLDDMELSRIPDNLPIKKLVSLDVKTGRQNWAAYTDGRNPGDNGLLYANGVVLHFQWSGIGHSGWPGRFRGRHMTARSAKDGSLLWRHKTHQMGRPMIVGDLVYAPPFAFNLRTGQHRKRLHPYTGKAEMWIMPQLGGCGILTASPFALFARAWQVCGYHDLARDVQYVEMRGVRPGCMSNMLPAGGLLVVPEASSGCRCGYHVGPCTVVYKHTTKHDLWGLFVALDGPMTPVKWMGINFGGIGETPDEKGRKWWGYREPRGVPPSGSDEVKLATFLDVRARFHRGGWYYGNDAAYTQVERTDRPWLYGTGVRGLKSCTIPLLGAADGKARYTVKLYFCDPDTAKPGKRRFDVKLQGETALRALDIAREAGGRHRPLVREIDDVEVTRGLRVELVAAGDRLPVSEMPQLCGIECTRKDWTAAGFDAPKVVLDSRTPKRSIQVRIGNPADSALEGMLRLTAPEGLGVSPERLDVKLAAGKSAAFNVTVQTDGAPEAGNYGIRAVFKPVKGALSAEGIVPVECLGRLVRVEIPVIADAHSGVLPASRDKGRGRGKEIYIRGGIGRPNDRSESIAYLKFDLKDLSGRPAAARLRIFPSDNPHYHAPQTVDVHEAKGEWAEYDLTGASRPKRGRRVGTFRDVLHREPVETPIDINLEGRKELTLELSVREYVARAYRARESGTPSVLIVDCEP